MVLIDKKQGVSRIKRLNLLLVCIYVLANIVAGVEACLDSTLGGDFRGFEAPEPAVVTLLVLCIVLSYLLLLGPVFNSIAFRQLRVKMSGETGPPDRRISFAILALQVVFLLYSLIYQAGTAGMISKNESFLKYVFYVVPVDFIFIVYLAANRVDRLVTLNTVIFAVSAVMRGWASTFLYLGYIMLVKHLSKRGITAGQALGIGMASVVVLPLVTVGKMYLRLRMGAEKLGIQVPTVASLLNMDRSLDIDFFALYGKVLDDLLQRLQHFSSLAMEWNHAPEIRTLIDTGYAKFFFLEGSVGFFLTHVFGFENQYFLGSALTGHFLGFDPAESSYATHTGILGWPIVYPGVAVIYLAFLVVLMYASIYVAARIKGRGVIWLTWLMWLLLLINGWFSPFIDYITACLIYLVLERSLRPRPARRKTPTPVNLGDPVAVLEGKLLS